MKQEYLTPFLKHLSLKLPEPAIQYPTTTGIENIVQKGGDGDEENKEEEEEEEPNQNSNDSNESGNNYLANMIVKAINLGLSKSDKYLEQRDKRKKKIRADKNKIKGITMANGIDMNYGGGILVFGPNFQIKQMIHMFYDQETKPMYFSTPVQSRMDDDVVNKNIKNKPKPYTSAKIAQEIKKIFQ